ncbi:hypothetical protein [uncultured Gammaproteobacteria bacterium]|nr:hypothetical protein [uncultured Gammaproteobacteria bacterium]CAC9963696.1 hypothetical protein [uncultured Gammaproteobacteria bacterium]
MGFSVVTLYVILPIFSFLQGDFFQYDNSTGNLSKQILKKINGIKREVSL